METFNEITTKHMATVKGMGILEEDININQNDLKEIAQDLGMTDQGWEMVLQHAKDTLNLAESHFRHKSYRECIQKADDTLLLDPFIKGARGIKAKAYLLLFIHEEDEEYGVMARKQAEVTLAKESNDRNALEVLSTLSSKQRVKKSNRKERNWAKLAIPAIGMVITIVVFSTMFNGASSQVDALAEEIENIELQIRSSFQMQEDLISTASDLLKFRNVADEDKKKKLQELEKTLEKDLSLQKEILVQLELGKILYEIIYRENPGSKQEELENYRIKLDGAENRIRTKRKKYNNAVSEYRLGSGTNKYKKI
ncbi:MAG: hypothetical protein ACI9N1_001264 [Flavobacteriales bacterium]|jgi:hypothetical protein